MSKLSARELRVIAHYGFPTRLETVLTATLAYQGAHAALVRAETMLEDASETVAAAEELHDSLPADLDLAELAVRQCTEARARLEKASDALRGKTEQFFEAVGAAAGFVIDLLEAHSYDLDRQALLAGLEDPLAAL
jgi:chromosome condensin MukBEF ATPase and DNA-binding subunit MukB